MTLSPDVLAIHLLQLAGPEGKGDEMLKERWQREVTGPLEARGFKAPRLFLPPGAVQRNAWS